MVSSSVRGRPPGLILEPFGAPLEKWARLSAELLDTSSSPARYKVFQWPSWNPHPYNTYILLESQSAVRYSFRRGKIFNENTQGTV